MIKFSPSLGNIGIRYLIFDLAAVLNSLVLSFLLQPSTQALNSLNHFPIFAFWVIPFSYLIVFISFQIYRVLWEYLTLEDLMRLVLLSFLAIAISIAVLLLCKEWPGASFVALVFLISLLTMGASRLLSRRDQLRGELKLRSGRDKILIIGAGEACREILLDLRKNGSLHQVVGILDDDAAKRGMSISGIRVIDNLSSASRLVEALSVSDVIIATQHIGVDVLGQLISRLDLKQTRVRIVPAKSESFLETLTINHTREVKPEDLLGRLPIELNDELIKTYFEGKIIFITGAGGSIGSEICHQLLSYPVGGLVCLSRSEYSLYKLQEKLLAENTKKIPLSFYLGDVRDKERLEEIYQTHKPHVVFHAAAHKHVPYMETHEKEALKNNVFGTENVLSVSKAFGVERFILVSTDKAVRPTNIMGASKRLAEMLTLAYGESSQGTFQTSLVRFGNVLGSRGSVVPLFRRQILRGGPITVTHPDVLRYFMTITEASLLVINAASLMKGGERFILDMGEPVLIDELVRKMIKLYGFEPGRDIAIKYTGLRPGEKLYEELLTENEHKVSTPNKKIFILTDEHLIAKDYLTWISELKVRLPSLSPVQVRQEIISKVPDFTQPG